MSSRNYHRATACALLAGCLGLLPIAAEAAPAQKARAGRGAAASPSLASFWAQLVSLWAGDHGGGNGNPGSPPPKNDEGPGMCPHGGGRPG